MIVRVMWDTRQTVFYGLPEQVRAKVRYLVRRLKRRKCRDIRTLVIK